MDDKFQQKPFSAEELIAKLSQASPLQASKVLIESELFEKKSSINVLDEIYKHFDSKSGLIDELVAPVGMNVLDGIISHKKLGLNRTGLTASRVWNEIKGFDYSIAEVNAKTLSNKQQLEGMRTPRDYNKSVRATMTDGRNLEKRKDKKSDSNGRVESGIEVKDDGERVILYRHQQQARDAGESKLSADTDHVIPVKQINDQYAKNVYLTDRDIAAVTDGDFNLIEISNELNRMKGAGSFRDLFDRKKTLQAKRDSGGKMSQKEKNDLKKLEGVSDKTLENGIAAEKESAGKVLGSAQDSALGNLKNNKKAIALKAGGQALEQGGYQLLGTAIIEMIKPLFHELSDSIENGFEKGVNVARFNDAVKIRFGRVSAYLKDVVIPTLHGSVKDFFQNLFKVLIEGILGLVTGMFKSVMRIISEGFSAIISSIKIICSKSDSMSSSEKADAITKLLASTVSTFVVMYFSEVITKIVPDPFNEIFVIIASGVASTLLVYLIDKIDFFSVKYEKRSKLVAEVFQERIAQIKRNTDAFSAASVQALVEQKLTFNKLCGDLEDGITSDLDVTSNVNLISDFMKVELKIRDTESFLEVLRREKVLTI